VHARDLAGLDEAGWAEVDQGASVFARVSPEHKLKIVEALQRKGQVVAMTGDGVNDAPALRKADIGVAMGIRGTEVAKESADMVITDDNFATIVARSSRAASSSTTSCASSTTCSRATSREIVTVFADHDRLAAAPGVLQILWLNLVTDIFPAMALALEPSAPDVMKRPPRSPRSR
jgi:Ca2+-transporting ATPase